MLFLHKEIDTKCYISRKSVIFNWHCTGNSLVSIDIKWAKLYWISTKWFGGKNVLPLGDLILSGHKCNKF